MKGLTVLARLRHYAPFFASFLYVVWLSPLCTPVPSMGCCGQANGSSDPNCDNGSCVDSPQLTIKFDASSLSEYPAGSAWTYTVICGDQTISSGGFNTATAADAVLDTACATYDEEVVVSIVGPPKPPAPDPIFTDPSPGSSSSEFDDFNANPPSVPQWNTSPASDDSASGPSLLRLEWCGSCADGGQKRASEGITRFTIYRKSCDGPAGSSCAGNGSVDFRVNLGRDADGKPMQLVIHGNSIAECADSASVKFPAIADLYELEIWHWFGYTRHVWIRDQNNSPTDGYSYGITGHQYVYRFTGKTGYVSLFQRLGKSPVARGSGTLGPALPSASTFVTNAPLHTYSETGSLGGRRLVSYPGLGNTPTGPPGPKFQLASTAYLDGVIEQTNGASWPTAMPGVYVPSSAFSDPAIAHLEDYVRDHFQTRTQFSAEAYPDFFDDLDDEAFTLTPIPYSAPVSLGMFSALPYVTAADFGEVRPQDATPVCFGASYCVRNVSLSDAGGVGKLPDSGGGTITAGPDVCVKITSISGGYTIDAYWRHQVTAGPTDCTITGPPFAKWTVTQPVANKLQILETRYGQTVSTHVWEDNSPTWTLTTTKGNREEKEVKGPVAGLQTTNYSVTDTATNPEKVLTRIIREFNSDGKLTKQTEGDSGDVTPLVTEYTYDGAGKLSYWTRGDGAFELHKTYDDSSNQFGGGIFDATIRPWKGLAFSTGLTTSQGAATLTKTITTASQEEQITVELIEGQLMAKTVAVTTRRLMTPTTDPKMSYRLVGLLDILPQPVLSTVTTRVCPATGLSEITVNEVYAEGASPSLVGRPAYRKDPEGKVTVYHHYRPGTYNAETDEFVQGLGGDRLTFEVIYDGRTGYLIEPTLKDGGARVVTDSQGRIRSRTLLTWAPTGKLVAVNRTQHEYDSLGRLRLTTENDKVVYSAAYDGERKLAETDQTGAVTTFSNFDLLGNPTLVTAQSYAADDGIPAIPSRATTYTYDALGRVRSTRNGAIMKEFSYDSRGRLTLEREGADSGGTLTNPRVTTCLESMSGSSMLRSTIYPSGASTITVTQPDGQVTSILGTAQSSQSIQRFVNGTGFSSVALPSGLATGFIVEVTVTGGELSDIRIVDGTGRTLANWVFSFNSSQLLSGCWRTFLYDSAGRITDEFLGGELVRHRVYPSLGDTVETIYAAPNPDQTRSSIWLYSLDSLGSAKKWFRTTITNDGTLREQISDMAGGDSASTFVDMFNQSTVQQSVRSAPGVIDTAVWGPDANNPSRTLTRGGLVQSVTAPAAGRIIYSYDGQGRQIGIGAPGGVNSTILFDSIYGQPATITTQGDTLGENATTVTSLTYYTPLSASPGQIQTRTVDGRTTNYSYYPDGSLKATWGADYPQKYEYLNGRLYRLHTFREAPAGEPTGNGDITEWSYKFGLLWKKTDATNKSATYAYDAKGRLSTRTWARGVSTTYSYDRAGQLIGINHSDATPDMTFYRDALGRLTGAYPSNAAGYEYYYGTQFAKPSSESWETSLLGRSELFGLDRIRTNDLNDPLVEYQTSAYFSSEQGDVAASLLDSRKHETNGGTLSEANGVTYARNSLTGQITFATHPQIGGGPALKATHIRDGIGRLKRMETGIQAGATRAFTEYTYVNGLREQAVSDRGTWNYGYNGRAEVTSGTKKIGNTALPGYSFEYQFDGIGNRESATTNGIMDSYTPNGVNQYDQRTVPAYFQVRGIAEPATAVPSGVEPVEPNGVAVRLEGAQSSFSAAEFGPANYYGLALPVPPPGNQNNALWKGITIEAWANTGTNEYKVTETRSDFLPKSPEDFDYDDDGNLTKDGRWTYEWDAENRLIKMTARTADFPGGAMPAGVTVRRVDFTYDWQGRRTTKLIYGAEDALLRSHTYFYDDWTLLFEVERHYQHDYEAGPLLTESFTRKYVWGPDLSGDPAGAGGIGGLLRVEISAVSASVSKTLVPAYDGNGNIVAYLDSATGATFQEEEYGPFGETFRSRSTSAFRCPIGWSSKYTDEETGLVYYGYRYYSPQMGRWINRDPIGEGGGVNLFGFLNNQCSNLVDSLGLQAALVPGNPVNPFTGVPLEGNPQYESYRIQAALAFHITAALGAHATWDSAMRALYHAADEKLLDGVKLLVRDGILTQEQGARVYAEKVNKLVLEFRDKSSPVGRFVAEHRKPGNSLPSPDKILAKKSAAAVLSKAHANERVGKAMQTVGKVGKACTVISIGVGIYTVGSAEPDDRPRVAFHVLGEFAGSIGGAWAGGSAGGAAAGARWGSRGGIWGAVVGTISGAVLGGAAGGNLGDVAYDVFVDN